MEKRRIMWGKKSAIKLPMHGFSPTFGPKYACGVTIGHATRGSSKPAEITCTECRRALGL